MSNLFLIGIYLLIVGNICVAAAVLAFLILFLKRQKQGFQYVTMHLLQVEKMLKTNEPQSTRVPVSANESVSTYQSVSMPDDVKIRSAED